jgi:xanthine dehydrogenase accessory factor
VIQEALKALADQEPRLIRLSTEPQAEALPEGVIALPMTCFSGGTLEIYIEPHFPLPRMMIVGNLPVAQALVQLGKAMNYYVIAVDPDHEGAGMAQANDILTELNQMNDKITAFTYVVVASHGQYDEPALEYALASKAAYVALVASRRRAAAVLDYLKGQGVSEEALARLKYPAGLDIQARRGDEIALSIMAEIVQWRRTAEPLELERLLEGVDLPVEPDEAIDPVCGMTVTISQAHYVAEYGGQAYYFCGAGCKAAFERAPEQYLAAPAGG